MKVKNKILSLSALIYWEDGGKGDWKIIKRLNFEGWIDCDGKQQCSSTQWAKMDNLVQQSNFINLISILALFVKSTLLFAIENQCNL